MNKLHKLIVALFVGLFMALSPAVAHEADGNNGQHRQCQHNLSIPIDANKFCYLPNSNSFVLIDSAENAIEILRSEQDSMVITGRYQIDKVAGRHDVNNIVRPVSVQVFGENIVFVATAANDSSCLGVLNMNCEEVAMYGLPCHSNAFFINPRDQYIVIAGTNAQGYDINTFEFKEGLNNMKLVPGMSHHYHVPRQSERIQQTDPIGAGLTIIAIVVVFLCLVLVAICINLLSVGVRKFQDKKSRKAAEAEAEKTGEPVSQHVSASDSEGAVYAAIAAAIHMYNEELHDEESQIITIQKTERTWTPWNAKFYNMNQQNPKRR